MAEKGKRQLLNWGEGDGNPFDYTIYDYRDIISEDTAWEISKEEFNKDKNSHLRTISFYSNLKLVASLELKYVQLLMGFDRVKKTDVLCFDSEYIDCTKPITVWLNYPFNVTVKATIYPLVRTYKESNTSRIIDYAGYYVWQIARVYADIYKNHWESVGIWGHGFEDLFLEGMQIFKNNEIHLLIGS